MPFVCIYSLNLKWKCIYLCTFYIKYNVIHNGMETENCFGIHEGHHALS